MVSPLSPSQSQPDDAGLPERLQRHFDAKYPVAESDSELPPQPKQPRDRLAACRLTLPKLLPPQAHMLELGAGDGSLLRQFDSDGVTFGRYVLSEVAAARIAALRSIAADRAEVEAIPLNAESIGKDLGSFDAVVMIALIALLLDPIGTFERIRAILRPGGFVWIDVPNIAKITRRIKLAAGRFPSTSSRDEGLTTFEGHPTDLYDEGSLHYYTYRSLERVLIERCGFSHVERHPYPGRRRVFGDVIDSRLARYRPTLLAEICVAAYAQ
jgi:SAM-dependent methyltransferase